MKKIDSHFHLNYFTNFDSIMNELEDFTFLHTICTQIEDFDFIVKKCAQYSNLFGSYGIHPSHATIKNQDYYSLSYILCALENSKIIAIGETGIDLFYTDKNLSYQIQSFENHIRASIITGKPLVIHCRSTVNTENAALQIRQVFANFDFFTNAIIHCFDGANELLNLALERDFYISISAICTYKSATQLQENIKKIPLNRLLIETDAPFLPPLSLRGTQNHPKNISYVVDKLAAILNLSAEEVFNITHENYVRLYKNFLIST